VHSHSSDVVLAAAAAAANICTTVGSSASSMPTKKKEQIFTISQVKMIQNLVKTAGPSATPCSTVE
jgi:hypothetical protein